jgi:long-chain fatty acid transport protein
MPSRRLLALVALCAVVFVPARTATASPLQMFGFGGRSPGAGATGVASSEDFDSTYLNPAGLADLTRKRFSFGTLLGAFDLSGIPRTVDAAVGLEFGASLPIPLGGALKDRVGLGLGFYVPTTVINRARAPMPGTPFFALLENRAQVVGLQVGVGVKINDRWTIGGGTLALAALKGFIHVSADAAGRFTTTSEEQLITDYAPIFGARWKTSDTITSGLTLRFPSRSSYDIDVTNDLASYLPVTLPELRVAGVAQYDPLTLAAEVAWRARRHLLVSGQLAYERWSVFPLPTENPVASMPKQAPPGFHDTVVPRVAAEWRGSYGVYDLALRGGYWFAWSPAPAMTGMQALMDNDRHVFTIGAGIASGRSKKLPIHIDLWFQVHQLVSRSNARPDMSVITTGGRIFVGGLMMGVDL